MAGKTTASKAASKPATKTTTKPVSAVKVAAGKVVINSLITGVERVRLLDLKPHPDNYNMGDVGAIAKSLKEGQYKAITVQRSTMFIIAGNHTWLAARQLGWTHIDVNFLDIGDEDAKKILIKDNRLAQLAEVDDQKLAELIESIKVPTDLGYTDVELEGFKDLVKQSTASIEAAEQERKDWEKKLKRSESFDGAPLGEEGEPDDDDEDFSEGEGFVDADGNMTASDKRDKLMDANDELDGAVRFKELDWTSFEGVGSMDITKLRADRMMTFDELPEKLESWGGSATKDWPDKDVWWLYNWKIDSTSGMHDTSKIIVSFYCVDPETEVLTERGWLPIDRVTTKDRVWSLTAQRMARWSAVRKVYSKPWDGPMLRMQNRSMDALVTPDHRWYVSTLVDDNLRYVEARQLNTAHIIPTAAMPARTQTASPYSDDFVELVGWVATEGTVTSRGYVSVYQSRTANPQYCKQIEQLLDRLGFTYSVGSTGDGSVNRYRISAVHGSQVVAVLPDKVVTEDFVRTINHQQRELLLQTMIDGDGYHVGDSNVQFSTTSKQQADSFAMLASLLGYSTNTRYCENENTNFGACDLYRVTLKWIRNTRVARMNIDKETYSGTVWCINTDAGNFLARRNGKVYYTGNCYDENFEEWWFYPERYASKCWNTGVRYIVTPDYSMERAMPKALCIYQVFRSRAIGRYLQECGFKVIPNIEWVDGDMDFLNRYVLRTLPKNLPMIAIQMQTIDKKEVHGGIEHYAAQIQQIFDYLQPQGALIYASKLGREIFDKYIKVACPVRVMETRQEKLAALNKKKKRLKKTTL